MQGNDGPAARLADRLPEGLVDAAWLWLVMRVGLGLIALLLVLSESVRGPCASDLVTNGWTTFPPLADKGIEFPLVGVWQRWDACWYSKIAAYGYEAGQNSTTFFPLFPSLMRAVSIPLGGAIPLAGLVVNAVALILGLMGVRQLVHRDFDAETADRTVLYIVIFPVAFFLFAPFTEALFLACSVWAILAARRRQWGLAILACLLVGLTRPQGMVLFLPVGWEAVMALRERWRAVQAGTGRFSWRDVLPIVAVAIPIAAYASFIVYTVVGVGQSYMDAHAAWSSTMVHMPWDVIPPAWEWGFDQKDPVTLLNTATLIFFTVLAVAGIRIVPASYSLFVFPQLALVLTQATVFPLMSSMRYSIVLFPCFVVLALIGRHPRFHTAWVPISTLLLGLMTVLFLEGKFVG